MNIFAILKPISLFFTILHCATIEKLKDDPNENPTDVAQFFWQDTAFFEGQPYTPLPKIF